MRTVGAVESMKYLMLGLSLSWFLIANFDAFTGIKESRALEIGLLFLILFFVIKLSEREA